MSSTTLYRLSGISLIIGSLLAVIGAILGIIGGGPATTMTVAGDIVAFIGTTLGILGLPGLYARLAPRTGILGLIGTVFLLIYILILGTFGNALNAFVLSFIATHAPSLLKSDPPALGLFYLLGSLMGAVGGTLLGIAIIRASFLARWAGLLLIIGVLLQFAGDFLQLPLANFGFLFVMIAFAWLGAAMWSKRQDSAMQTEFPASAMRA